MPHTITVLTTQEVAQDLKLSDRQVERMAQLGVLPSLKQGGVWIFPVVAYKAYKLARETRRQRRLFPIQTH